MNNDLAVQKDNKRRYNEKTKLLEARPNGNSPVSSARPTPMMTPVAIRPKKNTLNRQQINQCLMDIQDLHPIRDTVTLFDIVPLLRVCRSKRQAQKSQNAFRLKLKECIFNELDLEIPKSDRDIEKEPFLLFGYGVNAYFDLTLSLLQMFLVISVLCLPVLAIYSKGKDLSLPDHKSMGLSHMVLGNLGGATTICEIAQLQKNKIDLMCPSKVQTLDVSKATFGIISSSDKDQNSCTKKNLDKVLKANTDLKDCSPVLNTLSLQRELSSLCDDQNNCRIDFKNIINYLPDSELTNSVGQCGPFANFFIQMPCVVSSDNFGNR